MSFLSRSWLVWIVVSHIALGQDPASVTLDGRELWKVRVGRHGFTVAERAADIGGNLEHVAKDSRRQLDDIREMQTPSESMLLMDRVFLFSVTEEDARLEGKSRTQLFSEWRAAALDAIRRYRDSRRYFSILRSAAMGGGAIAGALALVALFWWGYGRISSDLDRRLAHIPAEGKWGTIFRTFRGPILLFARVSLRAILLIASFGTVFFAVSYVLALVPATATVADTLLSQTTSILHQAVDSVVSYLPNFLVLVLIVIFTKFVLVVARTLAESTAQGSITIKGFYADWAAPTYRLLQVLLILFALVVAFPYLPGGDTPALRGASIFVGVLVSLGSGSAMGNVVAGIILTYMRPFTKGDRVRIGEAEGDVIERTLLVTRIRTIKNVEVVVPNSTILGSHIFNFSSNARSGGLIVNTTVTIGYDAPWETVERLLVEAARSTKFVLQDPGPFVLQTGLNDFHISYQINAFTEEPNRLAEIYSDLHRNIQEQFNRGGVEIMSPSYLSLRDGNTVTTPPRHRPREYRAPGFRLQRDNEATSGQQAETDGTGGVSTGSD